MTVAYECDRKACSVCSYPTCRHTTDIEHAKNFKCFPCENGKKYLEEHSVENNLEGDNTMENLKQQLVEAEARMNNLTQNLAAAEDECARLQDAIKEAEAYQETYDMGFEFGKHIASLLKGLEDAGVNRPFAEDLVKTTLKASLPGTTVARPLFFM